jgi:hypothetical protein
MLDEGVTRLTLCRPRPWDPIGSILSCNTGFSASVSTGRLVIVVAWSWLLAPLSSSLLGAWSLNSGSRSRSFPPRTTWVTLL